MREEERERERGRGRGRECYQKAVEGLRESSTFWMIEQRWQGVLHVRSFFSIILWCLSEVGDPVAILMKTSKIRKGGLFWPPFDCSEGQASPPVASMALWWLLWAIDGLYGPLAASSGLYGALVASIALWQPLTTLHSFASSSLSPFSFPFFLSPSPSLPFLVLNARTILVRCWHGSVHPKLDGSGWFSIHWLWYIMIFKKVSLQVVPFVKKHGDITNIVLHVRHHVEFALDPSGLISKLAPKRVGYLMEFGSDLWFIWA